jgi:CheY-like chemotaxis protein
LSAIGQLAAGVAHDFNNILTVILGHAGLLQMRPGMPSAAQADVQRIEDAANRAASLTRQLLAFSRRQAMFPRTLVLGRAVQDVAGMLSRLLSADMKFNVIVSGNVPPVEADPAMIEQVVTNLVLNARDALENKPGEITVSVDSVEIAPEAVPVFPNARAGKFVRLSVRDTGMGIPPENFTRIFEPFFTTKAQGKGTGLGLSVVMGVVQQHGGWIGIESALGKGTSFNIYLSPSNKPMLPSDTTALSLPVQPVVEPKKVSTILLAEDEQFVRDLAMQILEQAGYSVIAVADGVRALEEWARQRDRIDLLFTDMVMPNGIGGLELSQRILADRPKLPVIYASGYSLDTAAPGFCESERMLFLQKPYQPEQLVAAVRKCLNPDQG